MNENDTTLLLDTLACDTLQPIDSAATPLCVVEGIPPTPPQGYEGVPRSQQLGNNDTVVILLVVLFLYAAIAVSQGRKLLGEMTRSLFEEKRGARIFIDNPAAKRQIRWALLALTFVLQGIAISQYLNPYGEGVEIGGCTPLLSLLLLTAICALFYLVLKSLCHLTAYIFADTRERKLWLDAFDTTIQLQGITLFPLATIMLYYPATAQVCMYSYIAIYIVLRIFFANRGVKIFFKDLYGLFCFMLYLCALEIAPLLLLYKGVCFLYKL